MLHRARSKTPMPKLLRLFRRLASAPEVSPFLDCAFDSWDPGRAGAGEDLDVRDVGEHGVDVVDGADFDGEFTGIAGGGSVEERAAGAAHVVGHLVAGCHWVC